MKFVCHNLVGLSKKITNKIRVLKTQKTQTLIICSNICHWCYHLFSFNSQNIRHDWYNWQSNNCLLFFLLFLVAGNLLATVKNVMAVLFGWVWEWPCTFRAGPLPDSTLLCWVNSFSRSNSKTYCDIDYYHLFSDIYFPFLNFVVLGQFFSRSDSKKLCDILYLIL